MQEPIQTYGCKEPCRSLRITIKHVDSFKMDGHDFIELRVSKKEEERHRETDKQRDRDMKGTLSKSQNHHQAC